MVRGCGEGGRGGVVYALHYRVSRGKLETLNGPTKSKRKRSRKRKGERELRCEIRKQRKRIKLWLGKWRGAEVHTAIAACK